MVNGDMESSMKAHEEMARRAAAEKARLEAIESQKALMMGECITSPMYSVLDSKAKLCIWALHGGSHDHWVLAGSTGAKILEPTSTSRSKVCGKSS